MRSVPAIVIALLLVSGAASADPSKSDEEEARNAMRRGISAVSRGDAEQALVEYDTAKRLVPGANAPYLYAAEALTMLGRYDRVVESLETYLAKDPSVSDAADVRRRIARIKAEHFPSTLRIVTNVEEAEVVFDGEPRGRVRSISALPGKHRIEARASRYDPVMQEVELVGDRESTLVVALTAHREVTVPPPPQDATVHWRTIGWVTTGAGAAILLATVIVDAAALGPKISDYRDAADRQDPSARDLRGDVSTLRGVAIGGYVLGGLVTAAGVGMVLLAPTNRPVAVEPWTSTTGAGLTFRGHL